MLPKVIPTHSDVIFGKGKPFQMHSGNRRMHRIASAHKASYLASKHDKILIADMVLQLIKNSGSEPVRFLKRGDDGELWIEVGDYEARQKVRHALRFTKTKKPEPERSSSSVPEQKAASASLPVKKPSIPAVKAPPTVSSTNILRQFSLDSSLRNEVLSASVLPVARASSINPAFLPTASLPWGPSLRMHGGLLNNIGGSLVTGYPLPPTMPRTMVSGIVPSYGMVGASLLAPRHVGTTPLDLLSDAQILDALTQRRLGRAYVRGRPQFP